MAWSAWLETDGLAPVAHQQFVFSLPKRLRRYFLWRRDLLGDLARVAAATVVAFVRTAIGDDVSVGVGLSIQTHGSLLNWNPHVHALVTDGGFLPGGTFLSMPLHDTAVLSEAFRRAVLKLFVERKLVQPDVAASMLEWMHSGFSVDDSVWRADGDAGARDRLARYCARNPVSLERMRYDADTATVYYASYKASSPTAGTHAFDAMEFIALLVAQIPDKGQVMQRSYDYYSKRHRGARRTAEEAPRGPCSRAYGSDARDVNGDGRPAAVTPSQTRVSPSSREARLRCAELQRRIYEVDALTRPACGTQMRTV